MPVQVPCGFPGVGAWMGPVRVTGAGRDLYGPGAPGGSDFGAS